MRSSKAGSCFCWQPRWRTRRGARTLARRRRRAALAARRHIRSARHVRALYRQHARFIAKRYFRLKLANMKLLIAVWGASTELHRWLARSQMMAAASRVVGLPLIEPRVVAWWLGRHFLLSEGARPFNFN